MKLEVLKLKIIFVNENYIMLVRSKVSRQYISPIIIKHN